MSFYPGDEPVCDDSNCGNELITVIKARSRSIGAFSVGRVLPAREQRSVGPFVFFDHMGPAVLEQGESMAVRPHPHIGLSTVTYLFETKQQASWCSSHDG